MYGKSKCKNYVIASALVCLLEAGMPSERVLQVEFLVKV